MPLYLAVFAVYPVLFVAAQNPGQASTSTVLAALALAATASTVTFIVIRLTVSRTWLSAALVTTAVLLLFWTYGLTLQTVFLDSAGVPRFGSADLTNWRLSALWVLLIFVFAWKSRSFDQKKIIRLTTGLNAAAAVLLVSLLSTFVFSQDSAAAKSHLPDVEVAAHQSSDSPDIYYVILDGYGRADVLSREYEFENGLVSALSSRNFFIADDSTSNYYWTFLSLASSLNLDYIQNLMGDRLNSSSRSRAVPYALIRDNAAARFLRERGYRFVHVNSTWGATLSNDYADREIVCGDLKDEFSRTLIDMSWLSVANGEVSQDLAHCHQQQFEALARLGAEPGPKIRLCAFHPPASSISVR